MSVANCDSSVRIGYMLETGDDSKLSSSKTFTILVCEIVQMYNIVFQKIPFLWFVKYTTPTGHEYLRARVRWVLTVECKNFCPPTVVALSWSPLLVDTKNPRQCPQNAEKVAGEQRDDILGKNSSVCIGTLFSKVMNVLIGEGIPRYYSAVVWFFGGCDRSYTSLAWCNETKVGVNT